MICFFLLFFFNSFANETTRDEALLPDEEAEIDSLLEEQPSTSTANVIHATPISTQSASSVVRSTPKRMLQPSLKDVLIKKQKFGSQHPRAREITNAVCEMICVDAQPFSMVADRGFLHLMEILEPRYSLPSRKHITTSVLPELYNKVQAKVRSLILEEASSVSFTTDMWSSTSNDDYMSLTAHFINDDFMLRHINLEVIPFTGENHSGQELAKFISETLLSWGLQDKVNVVVRDNARNIVAALEGNYPHIPCIAHTFQLVIKDGCFNHKLVSNLTATCRRLVGHFKHSTQAYKVLRESQKTLNMKNKRLIQDEPTRWDSTYDMLKRLQEQKAAILLTGTHENISYPVELSGQQWIQIESVVQMLEIFKQSTLAASHAATMVSEVIPMVNSVKIAIQRVAMQRTGLEGMKNDLLASLNNRYRDHEKHSVYSFATLLDPRFKNKVFQSSVAAGTACSMLVSMIADAETHQTETTGASTQSGSQLAQQSAANNTGPSPMWKNYAALIAQAETPAVVDQKHVIQQEMESYLSEPLLENNYSPLEYWKISRFKFLKNVAQKYLGIPPATVFSERLFSTAGIICDRRRNRLSPENVKMLVFLNKNVTVIH